jgi:hypothetical protein
MGLLSNLMSKIFGHSDTTAAPTGGAPPATSAAPSTNNAQSVAASAAASPATAPPVSAKPVDVAATLDGLAARNAEKLDWKKSIVDLMKLVRMDSGFKARKQLAGELNYNGRSKRFSIDECLVAYTSNYKNS